MKRITTTISLVYTGVLLVVISSCKQCTINNSSEQYTSASTHIGIPVIETQVDTLKSIGTSSIDNTEYHETKEYQVLNSLCKNELANERVLYYFWYDINRDGKKELWVMLEFSSGDWMYTLFNIDKRRYEITELDRIHIPRFSTTYRGKGYLIVERYKWGWEEWDKLYWDNGLKMETIYENSILPADNDGKEGLEYSHPKEPEMPVEKYNKDLVNLLMKRIFKLQEEE